MSENTGKNQVSVGYPADARPHLQRNHIDGPLLHARSGELHWLTWGERLRLWLGRTDAECLELERFPHLVPGSTRTIRNLRRLAIRLRGKDAEVARRGADDLEQALQESRGHG